MKKIFFMLFFAPILVMALQEEGKSDVSDSVKSVTSGVVKFGKDVWTGVSEGITEGITDGRKSGESDHGAIIVSNQKELEDSLVVNVLEKSTADETSVNIKIGFVNSGDRPVRIINLKDKNNILAIDKDGYAIGLSTHKNNPIEITVPEKAAIKQIFTFDIPVDQASAIRIWGKQYQL